MATKLRVKGDTWKSSTENLEVMDIKEEEGVYRIAEEFWFKNQTECSVSINGSDFTTVEAGQGVYFEKGGVDSFIILESGVTFYFRYTYL